MSQRITEDLLIKVAKTKPAFLLEIIRENAISSGDMALTLEVAARFFSKEQMKPLLLEAIENIGALVRECAIFELAEYPGDPDVLQAIQRHADPRTERSPAVREAASEALLYAL